MGPGGGGGNGDAKASAVGIGSIDSPSPSIDAGCQITAADAGSGGTLSRPAPIVQRPRTPPFQGGNTGSNPVGGASPGPPRGGHGNSGPVVQFGVHAGLSSRRSRVQIPSGPPSPPLRW